MTNATDPGNYLQRWGDEPNYRGTFGIILLCFGTLITCIWNTLHFNIPTRRYYPVPRLLLKFFWTAIALYAPELLLFLAINERINADTLVKRVLELNPHLVGPKSRNMHGIIEDIFVSAQCPYVTE